MERFISWTEIPVLNMERAKKFYSDLFGVNYFDMQVGNTNYAIINFEPETNSAALVQGEGFEPCEKGVTIYLNAEPDMSKIIKKVEPAGGKLIVDKTYFGNGVGYIAFIIDSEGNKIGLHHV